MEASYAPLVPLFRSETLLKVLSEIYLCSEPLSLREISDRTGTPLPSVHREVERLESVGIVRSQRIGRMRRVEPNSDLAYFDDLTRLLFKATGPAVMLSRRLVSVGGVDMAFIFGSWADRHINRIASVPGDIDFVVVGDVDPNEVYAAAREAEEQFRLPVEPVVVSRKEWDHPKSSFLKAVRSGPLVPLVGGDHGE